MISLKQMKYFVEIVDAGSYSRAAERLYVAQSALSRHIKELENELQAVLLERDARHFELTEAGRLFHQRSKRLLQELAETVQQTQHVSKGEQGTIRLLHSSSVTLTAAIGAALHRLLDDFPGVTLEVAKAASDHQVTDIEEGRADLGLVRLPVLRRHPNIELREVFSERLVVAVPRRHRLADQAAGDIAELRGERFVSLPHPERGGLSYLVAGLCQAQGFFPTAARATSRKTSLLNLIEAGFGIAIVPDSMREVAPAGVRFLDLPPQQAGSIVGLIRRRDTAPIVAKFATAFEQALRQLPTAPAPAGEHPIEEAQ